MHRIMLNPLRSARRRSCVFGFTPIGTSGIYNLKFGSQTIGPSGSSNKGYFVVRYDMSASSWNWNRVAHTNHVHIDASNYVESSQIGPDGDLYVFGFTPDGSQSTKNLQFGGQTIGPSGASQKGYFAVRLDVSANSWNWKTTAHLSNDHVDASNYVESSQIGPDGFLHVFGFTPTGSQSIYNLQFGGQTITPSGSGNKGYFSTTYNPYRGFDRVSWAGGGAYSASPRNVAIDESTNRLFVHGGDPGANSGYFQNFEGNTNCTTNPYVVEYNLSVASGSPLAWENCGGSGNYSSISHRNSTLSGTTFPTLKTLFDDNQGVAYEFGIQGNNFTGCSSSSLSFITGQPGFCLHGGNVSVAGGGGNVSARAIDATVDKDGNIIILGTQPSSTENDLVIGNVTVPASDDQHQAFYLVRYNTTAYEFDFFTLGGHGDANSSAIAVASIPYGDIGVGRQAIMLPVR